MGLWDKITGEFIDIIEWTEPDNSDLLCCRFPRHNNEIKYGAKLTVREGQAAAFVNEGQLADVYLPGMYTLETRNMPILSTLMGWKYGFDSPFKAEVYFVSTRQWTGQKWGTQNPVLLRDPEFGPVRLRAFGTYAFRVLDPATFLRQLVATDPALQTYEVTGQLRDAVTARFADVVGTAGVPVLELAGNYQRMGDLCRERMAAELGNLGLMLTLFYIENISLPPEVEEALDARTKMGVLGDLGRYAQYKTAEAIGDAARNEGGLAGLGAGMGAGMAVARQMAEAAAGHAAPPPLPAAPAAFHAALDGRQAGPFGPGELAEMAAAGRLTAATLVWRPGMAEWAAAGTVAELRGLFGQTPPPLPSAG